MAALASCRSHLLMSNTGLPARGDEHINIVGYRRPAIFVGIDPSHRGQLRVGRRAQGIFKGVSGCSIVIVCPCPTRFSERLARLCQGRLFGFAIIWIRDPGNIMKQQAVVLAQARRLICENLSQGKTVAFQHFRLHWATRRIGDGQSDYWFVVGWDNHFADLGEKPISWNDQCSILGRSNAGRPRRPNYPGWPCWADRACEALLSDNAGRSRLGITTHEQKYDSYDNRRKDCPSDESTLHIILLISSNI